MLAKAEVEDRRIHMSLSFLLPWGRGGDGPWGPPEGPNTGMNPMIEMIAKDPSICSFLFGSVYVLLKLKKESDQKTTF